MCSTNLKKQQRNQPKQCYEKPTQQDVMRRQKLEHLVTNGMIDTAGKDSLKR